MVCRLVLDAYVANKRVAGFHGTEGQQHRAHKVTQHITVKIVIKL
jgi:hypothetical protein